MAVPSLQRHACIRCAAAGGKRSRASAASMHAMCRQHCGRMAWHGMEAASGRPHREAPQAGSAAPRLGTASRSARTSTRAACVIPRHIWPGPCRAVGWCMRDSTTMLYQLRAVQLWIKGGSIKLIRKQSYSSKKPNFKPCPLRCAGMHDRSWDRMERERERAHS